MITSGIGVYAYLRATARSGSPLDRLSPQGRARFLSSLTFNRRGLTGFRYDDLQAELSANQVYQILSLFGVQRDTSLVGARVQSNEDRLVTSPYYGGGQDYKNYWCSDYATCDYRYSAICTHNC